MDSETRISHARNSVRYVVPIAAAVLACTPLMLHQWFLSHELCAPLMRLHELHIVISQNHRILVPWMPDPAFGHGFPFFIFYAPLATYMAEIFHLAGADLAQAARASFGLSLILSALSMAVFLSYINRSRKLGVAPETVGLAATVYVLAPYRMADVYVRGSLAECWSFVFFPLILLACHMLVDGRRQTALVVGSISYAALILSHNIMALYFSGILCLYILLVPEIRRKWPWAALIIVVGQALSAFFWIPALANMSLVGTDAATMWATAEDVASHAVYWRQFFSQHWGFGYSTAGPGDEMSFAIGWHITAGVTLMPLVLLDKTEHPFSRRMACVVLTVVALLVLAMTRVMRWDLVPDLFRFIQFPWRLLAPVTLFGSLAVFLALHAFIRWSDLDKTSGRFRALFHFSVILLVFMLAAPTIEAVSISIGKVDRGYVLDRFAVEESEGFIGTTARSEYVPKTAAPETLDPGWNKIHRTESHIKIDSGHAAVESWSQRGARYTVDIACETETALTLQSYYFPGWRYWRDGRRRDTDLTMSGEGFIHVSVPAGRHNLVFEYGSPPWSRSSICISLVAAVGLIGWTIASGRQHT